MEDMEQNVVGEAVGELVDAFGKWLVASGRYTKASAKDRKGALKALAAHWDGMPSSGFAEAEASPGFSAALACLSPRAAKDARTLPRLLALMEEDRAEMAKERSFFFYEVNPGLSALGFGAESAGGCPCGAEIFSPAAYRAYVDYHGSLSVDDPREKARPDLVLANLPFSAFATFGNGDPETDSIAHAAAKRRHATATLLRIDWTTGERLGLDPAEYAAALSRHFHGAETRWIVAANEHFVPMKGAELFIGVSDRWKGEFRLVASDPACPPATGFVYPVEHAERLRVEPGITGTPFPKQPAERIGPDYLQDPRAAILGTGDEARRLSPVEIRDLLGIPARFTVPQDIASAYHLLGDSVAVPVVGRAVRGLLRAVELD